MRKYAMLMIVALPLTGFAQYIGNPAGKSVPRGAPSQRQRASRGFIGLDIGRANFDVDTEYDVISGGLPSELHSTSTLDEAYFAISGGANIKGVEIEGRLGGTWIELEDDSFTQDPLEDSGGILVGFSTRYGVSPVDLLRVGVGGQMQYSYTEGDTLVSNGLLVDEQEGALSLFRGQIFTGLGLDLEASPAVVFSPYLGVGLELVSGSLEVEDWWDEYDHEDIGDIETEDWGFVFGGLDVHLSEHMRIGVEGRGSSGGWCAQVSFGINF